MNKKIIVPFIIVLILVAAYFVVIKPKYSGPVVENNTNTAEPASANKIISGSFDKTKFKSAAEWKKILTADQYLVMRQAGTETPYTGALLGEHRKGTFYSVGCNEPVFRSEQKYDSGTGWPSFWNPINSDAVVLQEDDSLPGTPRIEVLDKCGNHLGHVFDDGPQPTGKRYCINSLALKFVPDK